jgi:hypothetical protein
MSSLKERESKLVVISEMMNIEEAMTEEQIEGEGLA